MFSHLDTSFKPGGSYLVWGYQERVIPDESYVLRPCAGLDAGRERERGGATIRPLRPFTVLLQWASPILPRWEHQIRQEGSPGSARLLAIAASPTRGLAATLGIRILLHCVVE